MRLGLGLRLRVGAIAALLWLCGALTGAAQERVTVFAAASLKTALDEIAADFMAAGGSAVDLSYAGSSALARQIEYGAPAAIFISANTAWMDAVEAAGFLAPGTRRDLLGNRMVLIAPAETGPAPFALTAETDLGGLLAGGRLAMALVNAVPAGIYGREALTSLGLWEGVAGQIAETDNVRAALRLVALGEAPLGLVYATDARAEPRVRVVAEIAPGLHRPITYPAALLREGDSGAARAFLAHLQGAAAAAVFAAQGFVLPVPAR